MDQEIYDEVFARLQGKTDDQAAREVAIFLSFHYPGEGRLLLDSFKEVVEEVIPETPIEPEIPEEPPITQE